MRLVSGAQDAPLATGVMLGGGYRIERLLGQGGMGCVYVATQVALGREVALKTLHPRLASTPQQLARFYREGRAATRLHGPHVVRVYDFGVDETTGTPYIAMELIGGQTLKDLLRAQGPMRARRVANLAAQVAETLHEASQAGVVHRDLKSENVMLIESAISRDFVKVMDFGVAKLLHAKANGDDQPLTLTGSGMGPIGTPRAMAPEQVLARDVDVRTDLYALGCLMYELLTGHGPYRGQDIIEVLSQHISAAPPPPLPPTVDAPDELRALIASLLAKNPDDRPQNPLAVVDRLRAIAQVPGPETATPQLLELSDDALATAPTLAAEPVLSPPRRGRYGLWAALVVVTAVLGWWITRPAPDAAPPTEPPQTTIQPVPGESSPAEPEPPVAPEPTQNPEPPVAPEPTKGPEPAPVYEKVVPRTAEETAPRHARRTPRRLRTRTIVVDSKPVTGRAPDGRNTPFAVEINDLQPPITLELEPASNRYKPAGVQLTFDSPEQIEVKFPPRPRTGGAAADPFWN